MNIHRFSIRVAVREGKKKQVKIGDIKEILKVINDILDGKLYKIIKEYK